VDNYGSKYVEILATCKTLIEKRFVCSVWRIERSGIEENPIYSILHKPLAGDA
jgi:hypothetical protein